MIPLLSAYVSVFQGVTNKVPAARIPLADQLDRIKNGIYRQEIAQLRQLRTTQGKSAYEQAKRQLEAFTPAGVFSRRRNAGLTEASGLVHFDFDHPANLAAAKDLLRQDPWVTYAFLSPSGDGLKVAVWADGIVDDRSYKHVWTTVLDYFTRTFPDLAVANDTACKDIARLCFVSDDSDIYTNPNALLYAVPRQAAAAPPPKTKATRTTAATHAQPQPPGTSAQARVEDALQFIPAEEYDPWLLVGMALHSTGEAWARDLWDKWSQSSAKYDAAMQEQKWGSFTPNGGVTLATIFFLAKQHGYRPATLIVGSQPATASTSPPQPQGSTPASTSGAGGRWSTPAWHSGLLRQKGGKPEQTINNFALALANLEPWYSAGCWYDVVRERHMVGAKPVEDGDATAAGILIEQATQIRVTNLALVGRALDHVCRQTTRDLLQEWVATLPDMPISDLLTTWLRTYAHVPDVVSDAYVADVSRLVPVGIIARILHPGCQYRYVPILEGPEDTGKSKLTKALAGHDLYGQSWHVALSAGMEGKEAHMMLEGALIAELEELSSYTKTDENRMKALITAEFDSFVPKFANKRVDHPRRTVFIATVNPEGDGAYLKGQAGNTRFLPIAVREIDIPGFLAIRTQLFAEAKAYVLAHPNDWWQLDCEEDAANEREERRQTSVYEGEQLAQWLKLRQPAECTWQEVAELHLHIPKERWTKGLQMEIGKALRAHKWRPDRTNARRYWVPA